MDNLFKIQGNSFNETNACIITYGDKLYSVDDVYEMTNKVIDAAIGPNTHSIVKIPYNLFFDQIALGTHNDILVKEDIQQDTDSYVVYTINVTTSKVSWHYLRELSQTLPKIPYRRLTIQDVLNIYKGKQ